MFRRSRTYALIGLPLVVVAVVVIALSADPADPNPKGTLIAIFAVVGAFMLGLFVLQTRELSSAKAASEVPVRAPAGPIADPTVLADGELWAAMAVRPVDEEAAAAQAQAWEMAERSLGLGKIVTAIIFVIVPLTYVLESFIPMIVGVPVIIALVGAKAVRLLAGGGELDQAYENSNRAIAPLGLELTERPQVGVGQRWSAPGPQMKTEIRGALHYEGTRHGRRVDVRWEDGACEVRVVAPGPEWKARSSDGRLRTDDELPPGVASALEGVPRSSQWKNLRLSGGGNGILVRRRPAGDGRAWLCDLWLAERIADALG